MPPRHILTLSCTDRPGIVAAVATFLAQGGCNILESAQYDDVDTGRFFMRVVFGPVGDDVDFARIRTAFAPIAAGFAMDWQLHDASVRPRVLIMVSQAGPLPQRPALPLEGGRAADGAGGRSSPTIATATAWRPRTTSRSTTCR